MQNQLPAHIQDERDLDMLDYYLEDNRSSNMQTKDNGNMSLIPHENKDVPDSLNNTAFMPAFLRRHIGKLVKTESLIGDRLETKIGVIMAVGAGFIVLRQINNNNTIICDIKPIKYATIVHNNNIKQLLQ